MPFPRKRFGQHFLSDKLIIERIVQALRPNKAEHLVEIGPGQGALTIPILRKRVHLDVIEIDRDLIAKLKARAHDDPQLYIHNQDALRFDFATLNTNKLRIFGNLPYNITTPLLFHLLRYASLLQDMLFMVQKEVAQRMLAQPGNKAYGRLSVMLQYHCAISLLFSVPPQAFYPPPKVQSSVVRLIPFHPLPYQAWDYDLFANVVRMAFNQRRKTLRNSLKAFINEDAIWSQVAISPTARAEELSVADFVMIANLLSGKK